MNEPKTISRDDYLKALGLFVMGQKLAADTDRFIAVLNKHLGLEEGSRISDGVVCQEDFDTVLGYCKISVEPDPAPAELMERT